MHQLYTVGKKGVFRIVLIAASLLAICDWQAEAATASLPAMRTVPGLEEPLVATGPTTDGENLAFDTAVKAYRATPADFPDQAKPLLAFMSAYPSSAWRNALLTNLGLGYYRAGYVSKAITVLERAWQEGRDITEMPSKALVDRAVGELVRIHARLGHPERVEQLSKDLDGRSMTGPATEAVTGAREGLWVMRNDPGNAYLCGPMALKSLLQTLRPMSFPPKFLNGYKLGSDGVSLAELGDLATRADLPTKLVQRRGDQPIPVPSIMHWKADHFAAIVGFERDRYHLKDPTVGGGELWITRAALEAEGSGYFVVPEDKAGEFQALTLAEAGPICGCILGLVDKSLVKFRRNLTALPCERTSHATFIPSTGRSRRCDAFQRRTLECKAVNFRTTNNGHCRNDLPNRTCHCAS